VILVVWVPAETGQDKPVCFAKSQRSYVLSKTGIIPNFTFTLSDPPVTSSAAKEKKFKVAAYGFGYIDGSVHGNNMIEIIHMFQVSSWSENIIKYPHALHNIMLCIKTT